MAATKVSGGKRMTRAVKRSALNSVSRVNRPEYVSTPNRARSALLLVGVGPADMGREGIGGA